MARKGRFGRLPRSAPDLTSTIVGILREYQSQRDRNINDAWAQGGQFEGQAVTDERILQYWKKRRDEVDKDDPLYDTYSQNVHNLEWRVADSKQTLAYAQHKVSNSQMASFYTNWAKKLPVDSEAWRDVMRKAAQFADAAAREAKAGRSGGGGGGGKSKAAAAFAEKEWNKYALPFDDVAGILMRSVQGNTAFRVPDKDVSGMANTKWLGDLGFEDGSVEAMDEAIMALKSDPLHKREYDYIIASFKSMGIDIGVDGLTADDVEKARQSVAGSDNRIDQFYRSHDLEPPDALQNHANLIYNIAGTTSPLDWGRAYDAKRNALGAVLSDPYASPAAKAAAYAGYIQYLKAQLTKVGDPPSRNKLIGELDSITRAQTYGNQVAAATAAGGPVPAPPTDFGQTAYGEEDAQQLFFNVVANTVDMSLAKSFNGRPGIAVLVVDVEGVPQPVVNTAGNIPAGAHYMIYDPENPMFRQQDTFFTVLPGGSGGLSAPDANGNRTPIETGPIQVAMFAIPVSVKQDDDVLKQLRLTVDTPEYTRTAENATYGPVGTFGPSQVDVSDKLTQLKVATLSGVTYQGIQMPDGTYAWGSVGPLDVDWVNQDGSIILPRKTLANGEEVLDATGVVRMGFMPSAVTTSGINPATGKYEMKGYYSSPVLSDIAFSPRTQRAVMKMPEAQVQTVYGAAAGEVLAVRGQLQQGEKDQYWEQQYLNPETRARAQVAATKQGDVDRRNQLALQLALSSSYDAATGEWKNRQPGEGTGLAAGERVMQAREFYGLSPDGTKSVSAFPSAPPRAQPVLARAPSFAPGLVAEHILGGRPSGAYTSRFGEAAPQARPDVVRVPSIMTPSFSGPRALSAQVQPGGRIAGPAPSAGIAPRAVGATPFAQTPPTNPNLPEEEFEFPGSSRDFGGTVTRGRASGVA